LLDLARVLLGQLDQSSTGRAETCPPRRSDRYQYRHGTEVEG
jgi:hypothetical protein